LLPADIYGAFTENKDKMEYQIITLLFLSRIGAVGRVSGRKLSFGGHG
jgi:hypothetical protein